MFNIIKGWLGEKMQLNDEKPLPESDCGNLRLQRIILRIAAVGQFITVPGAISPHQAIEKLSWLMGFGQPPPGPLLLYTLGGGSYVCVAEGVLLWMLSYNVVRYRPLVIASGWIFLIGAPAFLWIDSQAGLPHWWIAMDSLSCLIFGVTLLWACFAGKRRV